MQERFETGTIWLVYAFQSHYYQNILGSLRAPQGCREFTRSVAELYCYSKVLCIKTQTIEKHRYTLQPKPLMPDCSSLWSGHTKRLLTQALYGSPMFVKHLSIMWNNASDNNQVLHSLTITVLVQHRVCVVFNLDALWRLWFLAVSQVTIYRCD